MKGMEMMLANMIGIKPDEMQAIIAGLSEAATTGVATIKAIDAKVDDIIVRLERLENGKRNDD